ncbi:hypothetical protein SCORR_v1c05200 [Spiroplasma corruscae]|uniref:Uncharacterized protein n=1 Tax=Spiroplasma corruscae TaxID=216934 RepID=A0A222EP81_9MOLU|nr:hypothetical protein [Spiroplasma corruscae]ASP28292.1 hypothetical protein SCORR_v1c05200 [Spiroplasma corruscae]
MKKFNFKLLGINFKNIIKNKALWSITLTFVIISTLLELTSFYNYYNSNVDVKKIDSFFNRTFFCKKLFDIIMLSVVVIYLTTICFYVDKKQGKINLEIKGGISIFQTYIQRIVILISFSLITVLFLFTIQSLLTLSISSEYFNEARLKVINFMFFYFLLVVMMFSITLFLLMIFNSKVVLIIVGIISCFVGLANIFSSLSYAQTSKLYSYASNNETLEKWSKFNNDIKKDAIFNDYLVNFEKFDIGFIFNYLDKYQWASGNYWYVLNKLSNDDRKPYGDNFLNFIKYIDNLFNDNYQVFANPNSNGFKLEDTFVGSYNINYANFKSMKENRIYNIVNKISDLLTNKDYANFLNILKDYSNHFINYLQKSSAYTLSSLLLQNSINAGYFEDTFKNYKTSDQFDFYFFLSSIAYDILKWQNDFKISYEKNNIVAISPEQSLIDDLKLNANINPFNQFAQLQFGNYYSKNSLYYYNSFSKGDNDTFETPTIPLDINYFKNAQQDNQPPRLDNIEEVNVNFANYFTIYFSYLIIFMLISGLSYIRYRKIALSHGYK